MRKENKMDAIRCDIIHQLQNHRQPTNDRSHNWEIFVDSSETENGVTFKSDSHRRWLNPDEIYQSAMIK